MSFLKKLVGGVSKVVGSVTGVAAKILPAPIGTVAKAVSGLSGFTSRLVDTPKTANTVNTSSVTAAAAASVLPNAGASKAALNASLPPIIIGEKKSWFEKNLGWIIPTGLTFLGALIWLLIPKKRKR